MEQDTLKAVWHQLWPTLLVVAILLLVATEVRADWFDDLWAWIWGIDLGGDVLDFPWGN